MEAGDQSFRSTDRRRYTRRSVYSFMHATATLSDFVSMKQTSEHRTGRPWTGLLVDISCEGAQVILPCGCEEYLREHQNVAMRVKTTLKDTDVKVTAQVKSIVPAQDDNGVRVGVQFTGLEDNTDAKDAIIKICEYAEKLKAVNAT